MYNKLALEWLVTLLIFNAASFGMQNDCPKSCICLGDFVRCEEISSNTTLPTGTTKIVIEGAEIQELSQSIFQGLTHVQLIDIQSCRISRIDSDTFSNFEHLGSIFISDSEIDVIQTDAFHNLTNMEFLDIRGCKIREIKSQAFHQLSQISRFEFASNEIENIYKGAFSNISDTKLFEFYLNEIEVIQKGAISSVYSDMVKFYSNIIRTLGCNTIETLLYHAEKSQLYSNTFTCDCRIVWMKNNPKLSTYLSNNACLNRKFLDEFFQSEEIASCSISRDCPVTDQTRLPETITTHMSTSAQISSESALTSRLTSTPKTEIKQPTTTPTRTAFSSSSRRTTQVISTMISTDSTPKESERSTILPVVSRKTMSLSPSGHSQNSNKTCRNTASLNIVIVYFVLTILCKYF